MNYPLTGIITWSAMESEAIPSQHRYRATVNLDGTIPVEVNIGRPGHETWFPDQLVYPLAIGDRIHGERIGQHLQWQYTERPVIGDCESLPGGGTPTGDAGQAGGTDTPVPGGMVTGGRLSLSLRGTGMLTRIMLTATETERQAFRVFLGIGGPTP